MNAAAVALAYKQCERITRSRARNFYYGIRLLPPRQRSAMCALYAMARRIDDIGDGPAGGGTPADGPAGNGTPADEPVDRRLSALREVRTSLELLAKAAAQGRPADAAPPGDPVLTALADTARQFPVPIGAFVELVEGCEWDIAGRRYQSFSELVEYCRRVAGTIGRLSLAIYGSSDGPAAEPLADALGVGLQLTNILRDLMEDRDLMGRVYLPSEDLVRFDVGVGLTGRPDDLLALICFETGRAAEWYERGMALLPLLDKRSRACTAAMTGIYRRLLDKIRLDPESVLHGRVALSSAEKLSVAARALATGTAW
ncbi:MAG: phytoene/squalene synthase family protein [Acidimicrobiales bacterium]